MASLLFATMHDYHHLMIDHSVHHSSDEHSTIDKDHFCSICNFSIQSYDVENEEQIDDDGEKSNSLSFNVSSLQSIELIEEKGRSPPLSS